MDELLARYTPAEQKTIQDYWETLCKTRETGKIADGIKRRQLVYWEKYPPDIVMEALEIHIDSHPQMKEAYTRGIMRNIDAQRRGAAEETGGGSARAGRDANAGPAPSPRREKRQPQASKFHNFSQRAVDYDALAYLGFLKDTGQLTDEKRQQLKADPRYAQYLS